MHPTLLRFLPVWMTAGVISLVCLLQFLSKGAGPLGAVERLELATYDWRATLAANHHPHVAANLGVIYVDEESLADLNRESGFRWPLPRHVYGAVLEELTAQDAKAVGFDLLFIDRDRDYVENRVDGLSSDAYFARTLARSGKVILATSPDGLDDHGRINLGRLPALFSTNAWAVGHDGVRGFWTHDAAVLRRVPAFVDDPRLGRVWHLGILLGAQALGLDLSQARVEPGRILLTGPQGLRRIIPVDQQNRLFIDWQIGIDTEQVQQAPLSRVYLDHKKRSRGQDVPSAWRNQVVLVGAAGKGSNVSDWGHTPVGQPTPLCLSQLNVANSMLTGRFIQPCSMPQEMLLTMLLAAITGVLGWKLRVLWATAGILLLGGGYTALTAWLFTHHGWVLPLALPLIGSVVMTYVCMVSYRVVLERAERRQVHSLFGKMVSPSIFSLILEKPVLSLGGSRRQVSIYFADVRGFTRFIEDSHARTTARLRQESLTGDDAERVMDEEARETLSTVNLYLGRIADIVRSHDGTLDKYIGDCVMAFWGAPIPSHRHAVAAVQAAIAVHRAIQQMNSERAQENDRRRREHARAPAGGDKPLALLPILRIGSAISSGSATAGFMGSREHISNYTVFGREVNIARRLEHVAGADRLIITDATFQEIRREAPDLAATFQPLAPVRFEGIPEPLQVYEVPWTDPAAASPAGAPPA